MKRLICLLVMLYIWDELMLSFNTNKTGSNSSPSTQAALVGSSASGSYCSGICIASLIAAGAPILEMIIDVSTVQFFTF